MLFLKIKHNGDTRFACLYGNPSEVTETPQVMETPLSLWKYLRLWKPLRGYGNPLGYENPTEVWPQDLRNFTAEVQTTEHLLNYSHKMHSSLCLKDAFENVDEKYREPVPDDLKDKLRLGFQHIQMDSFLILLYECIIFNITVKQNVNAEDYTDNSDFP